MCTSGKAYAKPPREGHDGVVVDVEEGDLAVPLPQHKEHLTKDKTFVSCHFIVRALLQCNI